MASVVGEMAIFPLKIKAAENERLSVPGGLSAPDYGGGMDSKDSEGASNTRARPSYHKINITNYANKNGNTPTPKQNQNIES